MSTRARCRRIKYDADDAHQRDMAALEALADDQRGLPRRQRRRARCATSTSRTVTSRRRTRPPRGSPPGGRGRRRALAELEQQARQPRGRSARWTEFARPATGLRRRADKAIELSRQETVDGVEERDGVARGVPRAGRSRARATRPAIHDKLEGTLEPRRRHEQAEGGHAPPRPCAAHRADRRALIALAGRSRAGAVHHRARVTRPVAALGNRLRSLQRALSRRRCGNGLGAVAKRGPDASTVEAGHRADPESGQRDEIGQLSATSTSMLEPRARVGRELRRDAWPSSAR